MQVIKQHGYPLYQGRNVLWLSMMINVKNEMDTPARIARAFVWTLLGLWAQFQQKKKKKFLQNTISALKFLIKHNIINNRNFYILDKDKFLSSLDFWLNTKYKHVGVFKILYNSTVQFSFLAHNSHPSRNIPCFRNPIIYFASLQ